MNKGRDNIPSPDKQTNPNMDLLLLLGQIKQIINNSLFIILSLGTMFLSMNYFVDKETTPKIYSYLLVTFIWSGIIFTTYKSSIKIDLLSVAFFLFITYLISRILCSHINIKLLCCIGYMVLYAILKIMANNKTIACYNRIIVVTCLLQAIYGILQYVEVIKINSSFPVLGSFDNPAGFAACVVVGIPFTLLLAKTEQKAKYLYYISILIIITAIILSQSRAGILSALLMITVYLYYKFIYQLPLKKKLLLLGMLLTLSVIIAFLLFFVKQDSATGRFLIWQSTFQIILDNPIIGYGNEGFNAHYMNYQADYFVNNPNSNLAILADNVMHPFNEYLFLTVEYGLIGSVLFITLIFISLWYNRKQITSFTLAFIGILTFAMFSYPFRYPFVCVIFIYSLTQLSFNVPILYFLKTKLQNFMRFPLTVILLVSGYHLYNDIRFEYKWNEIAKKSLMGKTKDVLPEYEHLYKKWNGNPMFLYNYGAELNYIKDYKGSISVLNKCENYFNDYDVSMLQASNCISLNEFEDAELHYKKAANMCPARFTPLYELTELYIKMGKIEKALPIAHLILNKKIKVPSYTINLMRSRMKQLISNYEE